LNARELNARELNARELNARELNARELNARELNARELNAAIMYVIKKPKTTCPAYHRVGGKYKTIALCVLKCPFVLHPK